MTRQLVPPRSLVAYVSGRCTQRCKFCTGRHQNVCKTDLTPSVLNACFEAMPSLESVCLAGLGEPLLADGLPELINTCVGAGRVTSLITNGHLVAKRFHEIAWQKLLYVSVSVNETTREGYTDITTVDALDAVEEAVRLLVDHEVMTVASFVVGKKNYHRIPDFLRWVAVHRVPRVTIVNLLPQVGEDGLVLDPEGFWQEVLTMDEVDYKANLPEYARIGLQLEVDIQCLPTPISRQHFPRPSCMCASPWESIGVDGDGNVSLCRRILTPSAEWGNVISDGATPWTSEKARDLRDRLQGVGDPPGRCKACFGAWSC